VNNVAWEIEHSVDTNASPAFAWTYMTSVANWDDPPAKFELDGPFTVGSRGTTRMPGQEPRHWRVREVNPMKSYTLETELGRAVMSFEWRFDGLADGERGSRSTFCSKGRTLLRTWSRYSQRSRRILRRA
jgi:hypothetical protein